MMLSYQEQKAYATSDMLPKRVMVAKNADSHAEILYFLAQDSNSLVRLALVENSSLPIAAYLLLAKDKDASIREAVANKITSLVELSEQTGAKTLAAGIVTTLEALVLDPLEHIRAGISNALKTSFLTPKRILKILAKDSTAAVARPVLENYPHFIEADFVELLGDAPAPFVASSLARRGDISDVIIDAILATDDEIAAGTLLENNIINLPVLAKKQIEDVLNKTVLIAHEVLALQQAGGLDEARMYAEIMRQNRPWVLAALALLSNVPMETVQKVARANSPAALTSLCWKAGLSATTAYHLQTKIGHIRHLQALPPEQGNYVLPAQQLQWHYDIVTGLGGLQISA